MATAEPEIRDLGLIGDQRTAAVVSRSGSIVWYCPGRFDNPSIFATLLDSQKGGVWEVNSPNAVTHTRSYMEDSAILETSLSVNGEVFAITDWMPAGDELPRGLCRRFTKAPEDMAVVLSPAPNYAQTPLKLENAGQGVCINGQYWLYASHPLTIKDEAVSFEVPRGEEGWAVLMDDVIEPPSLEQLMSWQQSTLCYWRDIASRIHYEGPYVQAVADSLRALRLLYYAPNGGVIAAATTSLPEVVGGSRNYDYRYVWLRDTGMIVSAMTRAGSKGEDERQFLDFICGSQLTDPDRPLLPPFTSLGQQPAPPIRELDFTGYGDSRPVQVGNGANDQLQLDGFGNVLLAAKLIYGQHDTREHWDTIEKIADFLVAHWQEPDHGIWEEGKIAQYTLGKVASSCGLRYIAEFSQDKAQAERWRTTAQDIQAHVNRHCLNSEGAYAAIAGNEAVDVSAVLFPVWGFIEADAPAMIATIKVLERDYSEGHLYWRHLECFDSRKEGAFLAGTIWVAQYWVMRQDLARAKSILDAALAYSNDLGLFAEEADPHTGKMQGNIPQAFVHAALIGAVIDYKDAQATEA
ncbi:GH15 family glucan-1,4-alpha-glucosidase [Modicisalibacter xianhensis]|uniref:GH15 family glucan-1,4-alpha-glucosidase n=1 Tax=Modicisalibacter xianhensis TaxID=442341 RepID=A0A4R8FPX7_9GAMM|nr:glycoside hydrolase family 15 protein [Halomonas xianhensis]TDX28385.1 GH15 family glucan-1,4-alpha-glucosidase [Halomonas xianhensis]